MSSVAATRTVISNMHKSRRIESRLRSLEIRKKKIFTVTAVLELHGPALRLFKPGERNRIVRDAFQNAGEYWIDHYLPLRFDDGYERAVLFYRVGDNYLGWKAMELGLVPSIQDKISRWRWNSETRQFEGPDMARLERYFWDLVRAGQYKNTRTDWREFMRQYQENRRDAMRQARQEGLEAARASGKLLPLVFSGKLQAAAYANTYAVARAAAGGASVTIRIPTPATSDGFNYSNSPTVHKALRSLPQKEVSALANRIGADIGQGIASGVVKVRTPTAKRPGYARMSLSENQRATLRTVFDAGSVRRGVAGLPATGS